MTTIRRNDEPRKSHGVARGEPKAAPAKVGRTPAMQRGHVSAGSAGVLAPASPAERPSDTTTTIPDGGEALTRGDLRRMIPQVLELGDVAKSLPKRLHITRAELEARLPYVVSDTKGEVARLVREDGHDYVLVAGKPGEEPARLRLADKTPHAGPHSPTVRIATVAKSAPADKPLLGLRVAIDPGHFGSVEDMLEGKFVTAGPPPTDKSSVPADGIVEGDLTVASARNLAARLTALGASVTITRRGDVSRKGNRADIDAVLDADPELAKLVPNRAGLLTKLDLERRAERLSAPTPDIVIALHFDAEQHQVTPAARKEVKAYVPGAYTIEDFNSKLQQVRFARQIQSHSWPASAALATAIVHSVSVATGAPPQLPSQTGAVDPRFLRPIGNATGVFARNLRMPAAVRGEPLSVYMEGATYNHPEVYAAAFRDRGHPHGIPDGFVDTYAKAIADGIVGFVAQNAQTA